MNAVARDTRKEPAASGSMPATPRPEVRAAVKSLLTKAPSFAQLSPERQQQVARDTALIADYLAAPEGIPGNTLPAGAGARALADPPAPPAQASMTSPG